MIQELICKKCGIKKSISQFVRNKSRDNGFGVWCKECRAIYKKYYYTKNKDNLSKYIKKYYQCNCEKIKEQKRADRKSNREIVLKHYGSKCSCCGEDMQEFLSIDHINNDGNKHRKVVPASTLYRWLIKNNFPKEFQLLCHNCNWAKHLYGECPHNNEWIKYQN